MKKHKILVVDDDTSLRKLLKFRFEKEGYEVVLAPDGKVGLEMAEQHKPQLIILDMQMPEISGLEFYERTLDADKKPKYPIVILTARSNLKDLFTDFYVDGFMTKPFNMDDILSEVKIIMNKRYEQTNGQSESKKKISGPKQVLWADDDANVAQQMFPRLIQEGFMPGHVASGIDCIEWVSARLPDLYVVNFGLKDLSGDLIISRLKQMPKTSEIPFILYVNPEYTVADVIMKRVCEHLEIKPSDIVQSDQARDFVEKMKLLVN